MFKEHLSSSLVFESFMSKSLSVIDTNTIAYLGENTIESFKILSCFNFRVRHIQNNDKKNK